MALAGAALAVGGAILLAAGGSLYYLIAGLALTATAIGLAWGRRVALPLFGILLLATLFWAIWEAGLDGWALVPRLVAPAVLGLILLIPAVRKRVGSPSPWWVAAPVLAIALTIAAAGFFAGSPTEGLRGASAIQAAGQPDGEWRHWGRTLGGDRFSPLSQINTGNVGKLELAWQFKSDIPEFGFHSFEATPLAANGLLYLCLDRNVIVALDQETGKQVWRFDPKPDLTNLFAATCRGVSWFEAPPGVAECPKRVLFGVQDGRLMAVDAMTGRPCRSFGSGGAVDLKQGLGKIDKGIVFPTSPPTIVNGVAAMSGWVTDGLFVGEPSGVIRGFDAVTGALRWA